MFRVFGGLTLVGFMALSIMVVLMLPTLPSLDNLTDEKLKVPMRVYTHDGQLIAEFGEEKRIPVTIDEVPDLLIKAILAAEDDQFFSHYGVDFMGIARAVWHNFQSGKRRQGASTITMQVARNFFLTPERTYKRKFKEMLLAFKLEHEFDKNRILELYINKIFLGHRAYGFASAAYVYYGKTLNQLTLPEMAVLAGLPKSPSKNNPINNPQEALVRRDYVLSRMRDLGYINDELYASAKATPPSQAEKHYLQYDLEAPYVAEMARRYMFGKYDEKTYGKGFHVYTTLDARHQIAAVRALRKGLLAYDRRHGYRGPISHIKIGAGVDRQGLDDVLSEFRIVGNLLPAVVLEVEEQSVVAYTRDGEAVSVEWKGLSWAKKYYNVNRVGSDPKKAADILKVGDVVYLEFVPTEGKTQPTPEERRAGARLEGAWWLAQIPEVEGALVAIRPSSGEIVALVGGFDFYQSRFNRVIQAQRQAGSNIKPFIYSAAIAKEGFSAATAISGAPIVIEDGGLEDVWRPENYTKRFFGPTPLRRALKLSLNLVSIRLMQAITPSYTVDYMRRFGFEPEQLPNNLSLALGSVSVSPLQMVTAFSVFANGGFKVDPYFTSMVFDSDYVVLEKAQPRVVCPQCVGPDVAEMYAIKEEDDEEGTESETEEVAQAPEATQTPPAEPAETEQAESVYAPRALTQQNAFIMRNILEDIITSGTGRRALVLRRRDLAGKTGTTNEYYDAWFSGFNSDIAATVWVGFDKPQTLGRGEAGSRAALPVWIEYMKAVLVGTPERERPMPKGIKVALVDDKTGEPVGVENPNAFIEYFVEGTEPKTAPGQVQPVTDTQSTPTGTAPPPTNKIPDVF